MGRIDEGPELTVYISNDEAEFQLVEEALKADGMESGRPGAS